MRPAAVASVALIAAALGAGAVLLVARAGGWVGNGSTTTVVVRAPAPETGSPAPVVAAKPLVGNGFQPAQIYRSRSAGVVTIYAFFGDSSAGVAAAQGSGFVVSADGLVLTNAHVVTTAGEAGDGAVKAARKVYVAFRGGDRVEADVVGWDTFDDVGVLRVRRSGRKLVPVPLGDSSRVVVGQPVAAIGSPFGNEGSLSVGVVSAVQREIDSLTSRFELVDAIQTDAPINHGNSGGPLFDGAGRVIGINAQIRSNGDNAGFEGVGFAVPINSAKRSMRQLLESGRVAYAYVGVSTVDLTPAIARRFGYPARRGALVDTVEDDTAAAKAGIRAGSRRATYNGVEFSVGGDAIVAIGPDSVKSADDLVRIVTNKLVPGQVVDFTLVRDGKRVVVPVRLEARPQ